MWESRMLHAQRFVFFVIWLSLSSLKCIILLHVMISKSIIIIPNVDISDVASIDTIATDATLNTIATIATIVVVATFEFWSLQTMPTFMFVLLQFIIYCCYWHLCLCHCHYFSLSSIFRDAPTRVKLISMISCTLFTSLRNAIKMCNVSSLSHLFEFVFLQTSVL